MFLISFLNENIWMTLMIGYDIYLKIILKLILAMKTIQFQYRQIDQNLKTHMPLDAPLNIFLASSQSSRHHWVGAWNEASTPLLLNMVFL